MSTTQKRLVALGILLTAVAFVVVPKLFAPAQASGPGAAQTQELLNVSYDPTRELWRDINASFIPYYAQTAGTTLSIKQSHGASGSQARSIIDGLDADVATLSIWSDTDALRKNGLIKSNWDEQFPGRSLPYTSTVVFVVRKGNPKGIRDWNDLVQPGVVIVTPNPKTSGNGKLSLLAAWGSVILKGGTEAQARNLITQLYQNTPVLDTGARGATTTFAQKGIGDVHLTMESEAWMEVNEAKGELEIVYPSLSILHEPHVAVVDSTVDRKGTRAAAEAYLKYLYEPAAQEIIAKHYFRPSDPAVFARHAQTFPDIELFPITAVAANWDAAREKFFAEGAIFDSIYKPVRRSSDE